MKHQLILPLLLLYIFSLAQNKYLPKLHIPQDSANILRLKEINRDIWTPFSEAYATADATKYIGLHTADLIRATGGIWTEIKDLDTYTENVQSQFQASKDFGNGMEIAFTFFERVAGPAAASERGIYHLTKTMLDGEQRHFFGKFHVFLRKVNGTWKIAVDYDSDEDGSIGEEDFEAGVPPGIFSK